MTDAIDDAFHRLDAEFLALTESALDRPRVRLLRAVGVRMFGLPLDVAAELAAADARDAVDRSFSSAVRALVSAGPAAALTPLRAHVDRYPADTVAASLFVMCHVMSAVPGAREEAFAFVRTAVDPTDWRTSPHLAMALQESGEYEAARAIVERALADEPAAAHAAHVLAHVHYETGEHAAGRTWLDGWNAAHRIVMYDSHFVWHTALHALAQGDVEEALARYRAGIKPTSLVDAGSMLWRCGMYGATRPELARAAADTALQMMPMAPFPLPVFFGCFALASAGDASGLRDLARRVQDDPRPGFGDFVAHLARALADFVDGRHAAAVSALDTLREGLPRVGGSNAQREIVEDTLIEGLLRIGDVARARALLERRLDRREHVLDRRQLARAVTTVPSTARAV